MRARGWRWYVFGAQAAIVYGRPRLTADVDVAVELAGARPIDLVRALAAESILLRFEPSPGFFEEARLLPMRHDATQLPIDIVITGQGLDEEFLDRARPIDLGGVIVPIVSPEDLIVMKVLAGRRKDLEDIRGVIAERGAELDVQRLREVVAALRDATHDHRLVPRLQRLLRTKKSR